MIKIHPHISTNHNRLLKIASFANISAWVLLIFYALQVFLEISTFAQQQSYLTFGLMSPNDATSFLTFFLRIINALFLAVVYWVVLRGISLGLKMIVEIALNFREKMENDDNE